MEPHDIAQLASGPTWQIIAVFLIGLLVAIVTAYIRSVERRVVQTEKDLVSLNQLVLRDYHNKTELNQILTRIENGVIAVHNRLDKEFTKAGFRQPQGE